MQKKLLSLFMACLLIISCTIPAQAAVTDTGFEDVESGSWYAEAVTYCHDNHLMSGIGDNRFNPGGDMSRAMLATVLYRIAGEPEVTASNPFTDVPNGQWYTNAIIWADENVYATGYGGGIFGTNDPVSREQIATILWRYAGKPASESSTDFTDENAISTFASAAVDWARANGIVNGKGENRFDPKGHGTRAEVATVLMNYHRLINTQPDPDPDNGPRVLVAYFSATNTTEGVAQQLAASTSADLYEITPQVPYTTVDLNYNDSSSRANQEMNDPASRPAITGSVEDMEQYDVVFLGYPIWWGQAPRIISTFLENYDFGGKTIVPFCTSGSSPIGSSAANLHGLANSANWLSGQRFSGSTSQSALAQWVNGLGLEINAK